MAQAHSYQPLMETAAQSLQYLQKIEHNIMYEQTEGSMHVVDKKHTLRN